MLVILIVVFTVLVLIVSGENHFFTVSTLITTMSSIVVTSFITLGAAFLMVSGNIDLSASTIGAFGGMFMAAAINYWKMPWWSGVILGLVACACFGAFNAVLVNEFNFQAFIATMAMSSVIRGAMQYVSVDWRMDRPAPQTIKFLDDLEQNKILEKIGGTMGDVFPGLKGVNVIGTIPISILIMIIAFVVYGVILAKSEFGMKMYLCGGNPMAARLSGIKPKKISYILFVNSAIMGGVSGMLLASRTRQASSMALAANMFTGMTAAMLGGISFGGGSGGLGGAFLGMFFLNAFTQGMQVLGSGLHIQGASFITTLMSGLLLIFALTMDYFAQKNRKF
jgi:ribose/xylose/arabinose/galactoside ABC-type transport system permease subunit